MHATQKMLMSQNRFLDSYPHRFLSVLRYRSFQEGEALGAFNAITAVAAVIAAFAAGLLAKNFGYGIILIIGAAASLLALPCFIPLLSPVKKE